MVISAINEYGPPEAPWPPHPYEGQRALAD